MVMACAAALQQDHLPHLRAQLYEANEWRQLWPCQVPQGQTQPRQLPSAQRDAVAESLLGHELMSKGIAPLDAYIKQQMIDKHPRQARSDWDQDLFDSVQPYQVNADDVLAVCRRIRWTSGAVCSTSFE